MSASKYFRDLNCMNNRRFYGSIESFDSVENQPKKKSKKIGLFKKIRRISKNVKPKVNESYTFMYESISDQCHEKSHLLKSTVKKNKYFSLVNEDSGDSSSKKNKAKKDKKSVKFADLDTVYDDKNQCKTAKIKPASKSKKQSILKRTGKIIVRTCRLMTYGTPYMTYMAPDFPYNPQSPPDYRFYDFETGQYDYSRSHMSYNGYSPSVFF